MESKHKRAAEVIYKDIYVNDCISGETSADCVRVSTDELKLVLNKGFGLKDITVSGSPPPEKLSEDGESVNVGGMKWFPKGDYLKLNIPDFSH